MGWKHAPPSNYPNDGKGYIQDDKCSGRGRIFQNKADPENIITYSDGYDKVRGNCHCAEAYWGPGCEHTKCEGGNGAILYPSASSNACSGRGVCNDGTGKCSCGRFEGTRCQFENPLMTAELLARTRVTG